MEKRNSFFFKLTDFKVFKNMNRKSITFRHAQHFLDKLKERVVTHQGAEENMTQNEGEAHTLEGAIGHQRESRRVPRHYVEGVPVGNLKGQHYRWSQ